MTQIKIKKFSKRKNGIKLHHGVRIKELDEKSVSGGRLCFSARKKGLIIEEVQIVHMPSFFGGYDLYDHDPSSSEGSSFIFNGA